MGERTPGINCLREKVLRIILGVEPPELRGIIIISIISISTTIGIINSSIIIIIIIITIGIINTIGVTVNVFMDNIFFEFDSCNLLDNLIMR